MKNLKYVVCEATDSFVYGRINLTQAVKLTNRLSSWASDYEFEEGEVGGETGGVEEDARQSSITMSKKGLGNTRLCIDKFVREINRNYFKIYYDKLETYQYTIYSDVNDHYDWHQDYYKDDDEKDFIRTLSMSICLSADDYYRGAEFFIKDGSERNLRVFKMGLGDFILFPSTVEHKVNALREGERHSLVAWYGYDV